MMVSELITIGDLINFLKENTEYNKNRQSDSLTPFNSESDITLPASCTFFYVLAYINRSEKQTGVPLRILSHSEYKPLEGETCSEPKRCQGSDMTFIRTSGEKYDSTHPTWFRITLTTCTFASQYFFPISKRADCDLLIQISFVSGY